MLHPKADEVQTPLQYLGLHGTGREQLITNTYLLHGAESFLRS